MTSSDIKDILNLKIDSQRYCSMWECLVMDVLQGNWKNNDGSGGHLRLNNI